jgi:hypothetical protein
MYSSSKNASFQMFSIICIIADSSGVRGSSIPAGGLDRASHSKAFGGVGWQDQWTPHIHLYSHIAATR